MNATKNELFSKRKYRFEFVVDISENHGRDIEVFPVSINFKDLIISKNANSQAEHAAQNGDMQIWEVIRQDNLLEEIISENLIIMKFGS